MGVLIVVLGLLGGIHFLLRGGEGAPAAEFVTLHGERIALKQWAGSPVLVNFWASDCRSCLQEMPALSEVYRRYASRGLKTIGVAMSYDMPSQVKAVVDGMQIPYPVALDLRGDHARAFAGVDLVPYSVLIAGDGTIVWRKLGLLDVEELRTRIEKLLKEA